MVTHHVTRVGTKIILMGYGLVMIFYGLSIFRFKLLNEYVGGLTGIIISVEDVNITLFLFFIAIGISLALAQFHWWRVHRKKPLTELLLLVGIEFVVSVFMFLVLAFIYLLVYSLSDIPPVNSAVVTLQFICFFLGVHITFRQVRLLENFSKRLLHHPRRFQDFYRRDH